MRRTTSPVQLTRDGGPQSHKHHGRDRVPQAHSAAKVGGQVSDDGRQEADDHDGYDEAGPAVPVGGGGDEGKQNLPENRHYVQEVVEAVGHPLFLSVLPLAYRVEGKVRGHSLLLCFHNIKNPQ